MLIRPTRPGDIDRLPPIEAAAGALFRSVPDLAWLADEDPICAAEHHHFVGAGLSWVAVAPEPVEQVLGFLVAERHETALHLVELSVHPHAQRRGVGTALLRQGIEEARRLGFAAATLTTFLDVPWNGPFYRRHDFEQMSEGDLCDDLRRVLTAETEAGLPMDRRAAMRRRLD